MLTGVAIKKRADEPTENPCNNADTWLTDGGKMKRVSVVATRAFEFGVPVGALAEVIKGCGSNTDGDCEGAEVVENVDWLGAANEKKLADGKEQREQNEKRGEYDSSDIHEASFNRCD